MKVTSFWNKIIGFFKGPAWAKAQEIASLVSQLMPYAITAVQIVSSLSGGNKNIVAIGNVITKLNVPATEFNFDPTRSYTDAELQGILMGIARFALKGELNKAAVDLGEVGLIFAGQKIKNTNSIPDNIINTAISTAYSFVKSSF